MSTITSEGHPDEMENARVGYQVAVNLGTYYGGANWSMFNAMLVANSVVVAGISLVFTSQYTPYGLESILPVVGLLLCAAWFLMVKRCHEFMAYYILSAREIEEHYLEQQVKTLSRGGLFADGKPASLQINGKQRTRRMSLWARTIRNEMMSYVVILVFALVYVSVLF